MTNLLPEAEGWGQQIRSRVKQNCCCSRNQSITVLFYIFIFFKILLFQLTYPIDVFNILVRQVREYMDDASTLWRQYIPSDLMNCHRPKNSFATKKTFLFTVKSLFIYCIAFILDKKKMVYNNERKTQNIVLAVNAGNTKDIQTNHIYMYLKSVKFNEQRVRTPYPKDLSM